MSSWRYIVQRATTGEFLDWDLPLNRDTLSWSLSGAGALSGTVTPDVGSLRDRTGRLILEEWGSLIYAEADGEIRWGGIIASSAFTGEEWSVEAAGFTTYPHGIPYLGDFSRAQVDPVDAIRELWNHIQSQPDGNLGVKVLGGPTPARLGALEKQVPSTRPRVAASTLSTEQARDLTDSGWTIYNDPSGVKYFVDKPTTVAAVPYELSFWEAPDCGSEIDTISKTMSLDFVERHTWDGDSITHAVEMSYPRAGRRREDLSFVQGDNIFSPVTFTGNGDDFANEVYGIGSGEGREIVHRDTAVRDGRLRRVAVYTDKSVADTARLDALIADELHYRDGKFVVTSVTVIDHPNAPIGSWQLGDDVLLQCDVPWLGHVDLWCRVTGWTLNDEHTATLTLDRSDSFRYGGRQ